VDAHCLAVIGCWQCSVVGESRVFGESRIGSRAGFNTPSQNSGSLYGCLEKVCGTHSPVVAGRMVFGVIITQIFGSRAPVDEELFLAHAVLDPVEAHVDGFGPFLFDCVVGETGGGGVVGL